MLSVLNLFSNLNDGAVNKLYVCIIIIMEGLGVMDRTDDSAYVYYHIHTGMFVTHVEIIITSFSYTHKK